MGVFLEQCKTLLFPLRLLKIRHFHEAMAGIFLLPAKKLVVKLAEMSDGQQQTFISCNHMGQKTSHLEKKITQWE